LHGPHDRRGGDPQSRLKYTQRSLDRALVVERRREQRAMAKDTLQSLHDRIDLAKIIGNPA